MKLLSDWHTRVYYLTCTFPCWEKIIHIQDASVLTNENDKKFSTFIICDEWLLPIFIILIILIWLSTLTKYIFVNYIDNSNCIFSEWPTLHMKYKHFSFLLSWLAKYTAKIRVKIITINNSLRDYLGQALHTFQTLPVSLRR